MYRIIDSNCNEYTEHYDTIQDALNDIEIYQQNDTEEITYTILDNDNNVIINSL